jgi:hypothetical protein
MNIDFGVLTKLLRVLKYSRVDGRIFLAANKKTSINELIFPADTSSQQSTLPANKVGRNLAATYEKLLFKYRRIHDAYNHFDRCKVGRISRAEWMDGLDDLNLIFRRQEVDDMFDALDGDAKGFVDFTDFCRLKNDGKL